MGGRKPRKNQVVVENLQSRIRLRQKAIVSATRKVLARLGYRKTTLSLVFVSDRKIKQLNQRFLRHNWPTDVLAFPLKEKDYLGEVIISPERARVQAKAYETPFGEELFRYICHGVLHLSGYSDKLEREKRRMRRAEDKLIKLVLTPRTRMV